ncbi:thiamine phosphate synthase [uncultured Clostridium sp.]|uniref:thiamine phosphate synthase n=1 Tax=uncultured Clostridium sp. TaxID=59620 RepID=UPI002618B579|nr:thiamine phosphate synthase [uncultured Clostridium sp.]
MNKEDLNKLKLYLVTDKEILKGRDFYGEIEQALKGGVRTVQLREKDTLGKEFLEKALMLRELTKKYNALFIVNDRVDIGILSKANGIHIGQDDIPLKEVRKIVPKEMIIGVSATTLEEAIVAKEEGADYIGVGAVFKTNTKKDAKNTGLELLKEIKGKVEIPIVAIGGIKEENIREIEKVEGYAIISDILGCKDIEGKSKKILELI